MSQMMNAGLPLVAGPRDVPALREWMLTEWFPPNAFAASAEMQVYGKATRTDAEVAVLWNLECLAAAGLWWVEAPMCELIEASATDLPPVTLRNELVPAQPVLAVFEKPLIGTDADPHREGELVRVDAIMWGEATLAKAGEAIAMTLYQRIGLDQGMSPNELGRASGVIMEVAGRLGGVGQSRPKLVDVNKIGGEVWVPVGTTHWVVGDDWSKRLLDVNDVAHKSMCEDRRWLATLWSLATTPKIAETRDDPGHRGDRRARQRAGREPVSIKVVNLRRTVGRPKRNDGDGSREYHVRWIVKGHWRQQAYGPGYAYHRPVRIEPYQKGPGDAPLKPGSTVKVLR